MFQHPPSTIPQFTAEILCLRMNEIVAGQLHANTINIQDTQAARIVELERQVDGMGLVIHGLRSRVEGLADKLEEAHALSVMCQALLTHYVESHWTSIAGLMEQIGAYAACHLITGSPPHEPCDLSDAGIIFKGVDGSSSASSLPSLESISSSSINSIYYSPTFLQRTSMTLAELLELSLVFIQGESYGLTALPSSISGNSGSPGDFESSRFVEGEHDGVFLPGDEGWFTGGSGEDAVGAPGTGY